MLEKKTEKKKKEMRDSIDWGVCRVIEILIAVARS